MVVKPALAVSSLLALAVSQQVGHNTPEIHPKLVTYKCTKAGGCTAQNTSVVIDTEWRLVSSVGGTGACKEPGLSGLNKTLCPDAVTCARNCALEGVNYTAMGVQTDGADSLLLNMYVDGLGVSPRVYLLDTTGKNYEDVKLANAEISFDVDLSKLPCGMNGALYLSEMDMTGGRSDLNPAGASMGTGYCDAQCYSYSGWINGVANLNTAGACCNEMDLWEANRASTKYTPHTCTKPGLYACAAGSVDCSVNGVCAKTGCGFNTYAQGIRDFYAPNPNAAVDTRRPFTVVTQFISSTAQELVEIRRLYVQNGRVIENPEAVSGKGDSLTDAFCANSTAFASRGGMRAMGEALGRGMVLVFSIWNQPDGFMQWLDGGSNGPCNATEGDPNNIKASTPDTSVTFSNVKWGELGTTYKA
ncbi:putative endo-beta-1,4-glucanase celB [Podospora didyma]|uniref:Glucanase n=1 Tax=Podospora didyma TaxID=330526 RepID=A0AAE0U3B1_9PEZI|nr:putative endo-beta-1,4-glucanase celB [Podospora didyma]